MVKGLVGITPTQREVTCGVCTVIYSAIAFHTYCICTACLCNILLAIIYTMAFIFILILML